MEKLQGALRAKEREAAHLQRRAAAAETERDALADEVAALGRRSAELEAALSTLPDTVEQAQELARKNNVLLELLGEKEEEVEQLLEDLEESRAAYKTQLEELMQQVQAQHASAS
ncbi:TATA element modulatory factor 1 TATA binding protein [Tribonema minus]|uniref:TATA element modulatory factor 1 TATA binding protein n=1 Tax=Tribonema minus TaxID=303371 RepID=A0A835ZDC3_9STRA|nr:TATA element modulatory factor 1 TATA binding protein [Tribonema minus]